MSKKLKCERCDRECIGLFITGNEKLCGICSYEKKESE